MSRYLFYPVAFILGVVAAPVFAKDAVCEIVLDGQRIDGPCDFQAHKGGSFDVTMLDGRRFEGATTLSLDVLRKDIGEIRSDTRSYGAANRSDSDPACWQGDEVTLCARANASGERAGLNAVAFHPPTNLPKVVLGRCHMGGCWWSKITSIEPIGDGSAAVPGKRLLVTKSIAETTYGENEAPHAPATTAAIWSSESDSQYFCSMVRPAYLNDQNQWEELDPAHVYGATEGVTNLYLTLCHGEAYNGDPYNDGVRLGYSSRENVSDNTYATFSKLTER